MAASLAVVRCQIRRALLKVNSLQKGKFAFYNNAVAKNTTVAADSVSQSDENAIETVEYPPIKPKYPPGKWGDMDPSYAWLWQKAIDDLWEINDVKERQEYIIQKEMSHINLLPYNDHPNYLDFVKYATKTAVRPVSDFTSFSQPKENEQSILDAGLIERMKKIIIDHILIEQDAVVRGDSQKMSSTFFKKRMAASVLRGIFDTLVTNLSEKANHLRTCQYDEDVIVRAVWDRHGIERKRRHQRSPSHFKIEEVSDQRISSSSIFDGMIRSPFPLQQVHPRSSGPSIESEKPELDYKFSCYGVPKVPAFKPKSILAGHILGDPCEFGGVGLLLRTNAEKLDTEFGSKVAKRCRLGRGLASTFTWLAAQAYNQGFSGFIDLTYPLVSQTVLSDGKNFSFVACQLNTLELWKPDSANDMVNLCWCTDEMPLYDCVENGQVKGFNDEVLRTLIDVFLLEPLDRGYDMKPTISDKDTELLHYKSDFIPEKTAEVVEEEQEQYIV